MIVIGYQGIGKSSLAGRDHKYVDLESGNFWVDGKRANVITVVLAKKADALSR